MPRAILQKQPGILLFLPPGVDGGGCHNTAEAYELAPAIEFA